MRVRLRASARCGAGDGVDSIVGVVSVVVGSAGCNVAKPLRRS